MSDIARDFEKTNRFTTHKSPEAKKVSGQKVPTSDTTKTSETPLDPKIARRVAASLVKHQEALEYLKNH